MKRILFQGDSITDMGRSREVDSDRGIGYATLVSASLGLDRPNEFEFINRGIGGNRIIDVLSRIKSDIINLKPDYMSILIGVNDVWHELDVQNGISAKKYEIYYNMLIEEVRAALPELKIMILEPFLLKGYATERYFDVFNSEVAKRAEMAKRVADKQDCVFVPLMDRFHEAESLAPAPYWLEDGVHPTAMGHEIIKREWLKAFSELEG